MRLSHRPKIIGLLGMGVNVEVWGKMGLCFPRLKKKVGSYRDEASSMRSKVRATAR